MRVIFNFSTTFSPVLWQCKSRENLHLFSVVGNSCIPVKILKFVSASFPFLLLRISLYWNLIKILTPISLEKLSVKMPYFSVHFTYHSRPHSHFLRMGLSLKEGKANRTHSLFRRDHSLQVCHEPCWFREMFQGITPKIWPSISWQQFAVGEL